MSAHRLHGFALQAILATSLLAACGGGGGEATPPGSGGASLAVTPENALALAAEALDNAVRMDPTRVAARLVLQVDVEPRAPTGMVQVGTVPAPGFACPGGGSVTMAWSTLHDFEITIPDASRPPGDTLALAASNCRSAIPQADEFSGRLDVQVLEGTWSAMVASQRRPRFVQLALQSGGFSVVAGGQSVESTGEMRLAATEVFGSQGRLEMSSPALTHVIANANGARAATLREYRQQATIGSGSTRFDTTAAVESRNPRLLAEPARYALATTATLLADADGAFTAGRLLVTAEHSSLTLTVIGSNQFRLEVDGDGDGVAEASLAATLAQLAALR